MFGHLRRRYSRWLLLKRNYCTKSSLPESCDPLLRNDFSPRTEKFNQYPQSRVNYDGSKIIHVGFVLARQPVIMPDIHPLEHELGNLLQTEYNVYNRHRAGFELDEIASQGVSQKISGKKAKALAQFTVKRNISNSSQNFWRERGVTLDQWGRHEEGIKNPVSEKKEGKRKEKSESQETETATGNHISNFYNLEGYADGLRIVANNWNPNRRTTCWDYTDLPTRKEIEFDKTSNESEGHSCSVKITTPDYTSRHTTHRSYQNFLYLIVQYARSAQVSSLGSKNPQVSLEWSIPYARRKQGESVRSTLDRLLAECVQNSCNLGKFSFYVPSNAPQGVFCENNDPLKPVYVFVVYYLEEQGVAAEINTLKDASNILGIDTRKKSHSNISSHVPIDYNWISRTEIQQYSFSNNALQSLLTDITIDGVGQ